MFDREYHVEKKLCRVNARLKDVGMTSRKLNDHPAHQPSVPSPLLELFPAHCESNSPSPTLQMRLYVTLFDRGCDTLVRLRLIAPRRRDALFCGNLGPEGIGWMAAILIAVIECAFGHAWSTAALSFGLSAFGLCTMRIVLACRAWRDFQEQRHLQGSALLNAAHRQLAPIEKPGVARY